MESESNNSDKIISEEQDKIMNHPFMKYVRDLNMTECHKLNLLARHPTILSLVGSEYHRLYADFIQQHPEFEEQLRAQSEEKAKHADCIIC